MRVAAATAAAKTLDDVLELAAEEALGVLDATSLSISSFDPPTNSIRTLINVGLLGPGEERHPADEVYRLADFPLVERLVSGGQAYFNCLDDPACDPASRRLLQELAKSSDVGVPIVVEDDVWGEVWATQAIGRRSFDQQDADFLRSIAAQIATVIERALELSRVSVLAYEDPLTGLSNRRAFEERFQQLAGESTYGGAEVALLLCDVDGLKQINDSGGHEAGDHALRAVAEALALVCRDRPEALVARIAGDEFGVLIDGAGLDEATEIGAAVLAALRVGREDVRISGGAAHSVGTTSKTALLASADTALYAAKREGGSRIFAAAPEGVAAVRLTLAEDAPLTSTERIAAATERLADALDNELASAPVIDRLEAVAETLAVAGEFACWAVSMARSGTDLLLDLSIGENRERSYGRVRPGPGDGQYPIADYPLTADVLAAGCGCFFVERSDPRADPKELALLDEFSVDSVVGAVATVDGDGYLIELYGDDRTPCPRDIRTALRLATRAAMPVGPGPGAAEYTGRRSTA